MTSIDCPILTKNDIYEMLDLMDTYIPKEKIDYLKSFLDKYGNFQDLCKNTNDFNIFIKNLLDSILNDTIPNDSILKLENFINKYLDLYFKSCPNTFCENSTDKNTFNFSCDNYKDLFNDILDLKITFLPILKEKFPKYDFIYSILDNIKSIDDICTTINDLGGIQTVINLIETQLKTDLLNNSIQQIYNCLCPNKPPPNNIEIPIYNIQTIYILSIIIIIIIFILFIILIIIYYSFNKLIINNTLLTFIILILLGFGILSLIFYLNPKCYIKNCIQKSDDWIPVEGNFKGSASKLTIKLDVDVNISKDNNVKFNKLTCSGKFCPFNDILGKCDNDKTAKIDTIKTEQGYQVYGGCIDKIYEFKNNDGSKIVESIYVENLNGKLNVLSVLNGCAGTYCVNKLVLQIPLDKY